jgi:hypothetical protein
MMRSSLPQSLYIHSHDRFLSSNYIMPAMKTKSINEHRMNQLSVYSISCYAQIIWIEDIDYCDMNIFGVTESVKESPRTACELLHLITYM